MKQGLNFALFGAVLAVTAGLIGAYGLPGFSGVSDTTGLAATQMLGHITLTHTDADGNIIGYKQTDNIIVDIGESCAAKSLFGRTGDGTTGSGSGLIFAPSEGTLTVSCDLDMNTGVFDVIAIGNSTDASPFVTAGDTALDSEINQTNSGGNTDAGNLERASSASRTKVYNDGTSGVDTVISAQFTNTNGLSYTITESGLFNSTGGPLDGTQNNVNSTTRMFAHQGFGGITLDNDESLTVEWTVTIGGTDTLGGTEPTGP